MYNLGSFNPKSCFRLAYLKILWSYCHYLFTSNHDFTVYLNQCMYSNLLYSWQASYPIELFLWYKKPSHNQTNIWHVNLNTLDWFPYFLLTDDGTQVLPKTINVRDDNTVLQQDYFINADIQPKAGELQSNDKSTPWNLQNLLCCFHLDFV